MQKSTTVLAAAITAALAVAAAPAAAEEAKSGLNNINVSAILNGGFTSRDEDFTGISGLPIDGDHASGPQDGFWLDHSELALSGAADDMIYGKMTVVLEDHDGDTEVELEEAFIQTMGLPHGLAIRAGRFMSNVGYLNAKHTHTDYYADRPIAYRGLLGRHYYDDGVRLNWVAPTDFYLEFGVEAFKGGQFPAASGDTVGSHVVYSKIGDDISESLSWQGGLAWMKTDVDPDHCSSHDHGHDDEHDEHDEHEEHHDDHDEHEEHEAGPAFCEFDGDKDFYVADFVLKWAPGGNYKYQSVTWQTEWIKVDEDGAVFHEEHDDHEEEEHEEHGEWEAFDADNTGWYTSLVYQWSPHWAAGVRYSEIDADDAYAEEGFDSPKAYDFMLQYNFSHFSLLRFQYTRDESQADGVEDNVFTLQYTTAIGDHGAHMF
ncbi:hypothetical protein IC617_15640 [Neiella sp. HB171785]|uniref:TonB-dependent receptor n=1 Tax=Neiella litorisoli TaxID=2771431 RepID=A0A8J6R3X1_9GAMM|nr:hypothetical protein [Neiella litorisoli]MBD1390865.1 hypothetical protein [Neiella litorisoli]